MFKYLLCILLTLTAVNIYAEETAAPSFTLNTNAFLDNTIIPVLYTCDGKNESPQFTITALPAKTKSLALIINDPDAPTQPFYHWVVFNLPTNTTELKQGLSTPPAGSIFGMNSFNKSAYDGPCPPKGTTHNYVFTLYALDNNLSLDNKATGKDVIAAMKGHIVGQTKLTGTYSRWLQ